MMKIHSALLSLETLAACDDLCRSGWVIEVARAFEPVEVARRATRFSRAGKPVPLRLRLRDRRAGFIRNTGMPASGSATFKCIVTAKTHDFRGCERQRVEDPPERTLR